MILVGILMLTLDKGCYGILMRGNVSYFLNLAPFFSVHFLPRIFYIKRVHVILRYFFFFNYHELDTVNINNLPNFSISPILVLLFLYFTRFFYLFTYYLSPFLNRFCIGKYSFVSLRKIISNFILE